MIWHKSHNDYLNTRKVFYASKQGCTIFKVDVILRFNKMICSHGFIGYGKLENYFDILNGAGDYLHIKLKQNNIKILYKLIDLINKYNVICLIDGVNRFWSKRGKLAKFFFDNFKSPKLLYWNDFKKDKEIITHKYYKSKPFYKRILHF